MIVLMMIAPRAIGMECENRILLATMAAATAGGIMSTRTGFEGTTRGEEMSI